MDDFIELALDSVDGVVDCRLERLESDVAIGYNATILYPPSKGGSNRSEIFCYDLWCDRAGSNFYFNNDEPLHPKVVVLEKQLSDAIVQHLGSHGNR